MYRDRKVVVVMPADNAARALLRACDEVTAQGVVDLVIVVDDVPPGAVGPDPVPTVSSP
jgi:hypothetical protein